MHMDIDINQPLKLSRSRSVAVVAVFDCTDILPHLGDGSRHLPERYFPTKNPLAAGSRFLALCFSWRQYAANDHGASIVVSMVLGPVGVVKHTNS